MADVLKELIVKIGSQTNTSGFKKLDSATAKSKHNIDVLGNSIRNALGFVAAGIGIKQIIDTNVQIDSMNRSFEALAGSAEGGVSQIKYLREEANRLGQDFLVLGEAYKGMFAAGKGAGFSQATTRDVFSAVLEEATVLGLSSEKTEKALLALTQMMSKGKVSAEELRGQLGDALPDALVLSARAMGVTSQEFEKLMAKGIRSSEFLPKLAKAIRNQYSGKLPKAIGSTRAELARLNNEVRDIIKSILDGKAGNEFAKTIREITKLLKSGEFKASLKLINTTVALILKNLKLIVGLGLIWFLVNATRQIKFLTAEIIWNNLALIEMQLALKSIVAGDIMVGLTGMAKVFKAIAGSILIATRNTALWLLPLLAVIEAIDIIQGKRTILGTMFKNMPTVSEATGYNIGGGSGFSDIMNMPAVIKTRSALFPSTAPILRDSGMFNRQGQPVLNVQNNVNVDKNGNVYITTQDVSNYVDSRR